LLFSSSWQCRTKISSSQSKEIELGLPVAGTRMPATSALG
jgi:hypothetical protein